MPESTNTIIGEFYAPADEDGVRRRIIIQVDPKNVITEDGRTLEELLSDNTYSDVSETASGLATPQMLQNINNLMLDKVVISSSDPGESCLWYQIKEETEGTVN